MGPGFDSKETPVKVLFSNEKQKSVRVNFNDKLLRFL